MRGLEPPPTATWLLEHVNAGERNEALAGDLLEEFQSGRTAGWYWRQVLVAIALGCSRNILSHTRLIVFAVLWSMAAPSWFVFTDKIQNNSSALNGMLCRLPFPWSTIGYFGLGFATALSFTWMGILLYFFLQTWATGNFDNTQLKRTLLRSVFVLIALVALTIFLPFGHSIDRRTLTPLKAVTDPRMWAMVPRLHSLVMLLVTLWTATSPFEKRREIAGRGNGSA
jgi:hypothetical protein